MWEKTRTTANDASFSLEGYNAPFKKNDEKAPMQEAPGER